MSHFQQLKIWLVQMFGLPKDALHIYVGLILFFAAAALLRCSLRSWKPLGAVLVAALAGETWDLIDTWTIGGRPQWLRNWHDVWNTCFWPAVLFLLARHTRLLRR